ncbi:MAG: trypsin-like peptidase domain-containing protein [Armatimonadota bacterium]
MKKHMCNITLPCMVIIWTLALAASCAADIASDGRAVADKYKDAIVTVNLVLETKVSYQGGSDNEQQKVTSTATIIDPSGLAVTSLSDIDPTLFSSYMEHDDSFSMSADVIDLKIKLSDGTEVPADIVLRDKDLDLAFIKPKTAPKAAMTYIDLSKASTPQMLDELIVISRLGQIANRALAAYVDRVQAVLTKPRTLYVVTGIFGLGSPTFTPDGKIVGIVVVRVDQSKDNDSTSRSMGYGDSLYVVLPASTIAKAAAQAKEAAPAK